MEKNRFFLTVNRINSVLILLVALGALISMIVLNILSSTYGSRNAVQVHDEKSNKTVDLRLGDLEAMKGHDIETVKLFSDASARGFSSGYPGSQIRNILFLFGDDLKAKWLYESNNFLINCFCKLRASNKYNGEDPVIAVYVAVVKNDTNGDGDISAEDGLTLALAKPDGSDYTEIDKGIRKVLDSTVSADGQSVTFLLHIDTNIVAKKYSLSTFGLISERTISEISKNL